MSNPEFDVTIFVVGCIGAIAPEIIRLYNLRERQDRFAWSWFYLVITCFFVALGGLVAWILPTITYYGAFYAGVTTPIIITSMLKKVQSKKSIDGNFERNKGILKEERNLKGLSQIEKQIHQAEREKGTAGGLVKHPIDKWLLIQNYIYVW